MDQIKNSDRPVSGSALAKTFQVSRQVIVQDIALIRAEGNNVISTNRGYNGQSQSLRTHRGRTEYRFQAPGGEFYGGHSKR